MDDLIQTDSPFTAEERHAIGRVAAVIIGPSDEYDLPAADDASILATILTKARRHDARIREGLTVLRNLIEPLTLDTITDTELSAQVDEHEEAIAGFLRLVLPPDEIANSSPLRVPSKSITRPYISQ